MTVAFIAHTTSTLKNRRSKLNALAANAIDEVKVALRLTAESIVKSAQDNYMTAIPGETYVRTGHLRDSWEIGNVKERQRAGITIDIENLAEYSGWVQADETQTERHRDAQWRTIETITKEHAHEQANRVRAAIRRAARG